MAMIDDFRANIIGGGARPNQFKVEINTPPGIATGLDNPPLILKKRRGRPPRPCKQLCQHRLRSSLGFQKDRHLD